MNTYELEFARLLLLALVMSSLTTAGAQLAYIVIALKTEPAIPRAWVVRR